MFPEFFPEQLGEEKTGKNMLRELVTTLMDCRRTGGNYLFGKGRFVLRGFTADPAFELSKCTIIKDSNTTTTGTAHGLFIKRYNCRGLWRTLKRTLQLPRSYECLAAAIRLQKAGIATPAVFLASRYYLITEVLPEDAVFLDKEPELTSGVVSVLAKMHDAGIYHGDVNLRNIYFLNGQYGFIDLDSARIFPKGISKSLRRQELARLISSYAREYSSRQEPLSESILDEFTNQVTACYRERTGINLLDSKLNERIQYLIRRVRRR
mgnify:FL=1